MAGLGEIFSPHIVVVAKDAPAPFFPPVAGMVAHAQEGGARAASRAAAPRSHAADAPWEARARAARVQTAGEDLWWWWCAHQLRITSGRLPLIGGSIVRVLAMSRCEVLGRVSPWRVGLDIPLAVVALGREMVTRLPFRRSCSA